MSATQSATVVTAGVVFCFLGGGLTAGCGPARQAHPDADNPITVTIAPRGEAPAPTGAAPADEPALAPRALAFEMAGFSAPADDDTLEQRSAATQAAVIDAFCQAVAEARRARGQSVFDFTAELGPRLTVRHARVDDGYQVTVEVASRGMASSFVVRDGRLQHPPRDLKLLQRVFQETGGEFSLLGTEWRPDAGICFAKVGCYRPAQPLSTLEGTLAGDAAEPADVPQVP